MIPLLSPKPFAEYSPEEYLAYVRSLYQEPEKAAPPKDFRVTITKKGTVVIRINRKPKFLFASEVQAIATELSWPLMRAWLHIVGKKIEVRRE